MTRFILCCLVAVTGLNFPTPAKAAYITQDKLWDLCTTKQKGDAYDVKQGMCLGYITGAADGWTDAGEAATPPHPMFCPPPNVSTGDLRDVVLTYMQGHPERGKEAASFIVLSSLNEHFPCAETK